jgi:hypothetical protein
MDSITAEQAEIIERIREMAPKGSDVYTILRHVSGSGMSRRISVIVIKDGEPRDISWSIAKLGLFKMDANKDGLKVGGAGMDMGFHVVYSLASKIYGDGYALKQRWL